MKEIKNKTIVIYEGSDGPVSLSIDTKTQTIWLSQKEIATLFAKDSDTIGKHLQNIYKDNELTENRTTAFFAVVQNEGDRAIKRDIKLYNLDAIISVGYRVSSKKGTQFRIWANKILKNYILKGYSINKKLIKKNYQLFQNAVEDVKRLVPQSNSTEMVGILEIIRSFASTWLSLDAYDRSELPQKGQTIRSIDLTADELLKDIQTLKEELIRNQTASELFATERSHGAIENIVRNIFQSFNGNELYPSLEEKAAYLLYFIIKNHPFMDGNKRSGAFSFLWFLRKAQLLNTLQISPEVLTTLTIMIAESHMNDKEKMISIVLMLLKNNYKS